jgi:hypothetical protein
MASTLQRRLYIRDPTQPGVVAHCVADLGSLGPLDVHELHISVPSETAEGDSGPRGAVGVWNGAPAVWSGAIYLTAPSAGVALYSLRVFYGAKDIMDAEITLDRHSETRPLVSWGLRSLWDSIPARDRRTR